MDSCFLAMYVIGLSMSLHLLGLGMPLAKVGRFGSALAVGANLWTIPEMLCELHPCQKVSWHVCKQTGVRHFNINSFASGIKHRAGRLPANSGAPWRRRRPQAGLHWDRKDGTTQGLRPTLEGSAQEAALRSAPSQQSVRPSAGSIQCGTHLPRGHAPAWSCAVSSLASLTPPHQDMTKDPKEGRTIMCRHAQDRKQLNGDSVSQTHFSDIRREVVGHEIPTSQQSIQQQGQSGTEP